MDNQGAASHLCLAIGNRSRHKCRKCLIQAPHINTPGMVGNSRNFEAENQLRSDAQKALVQQWSAAELLTPQDKQCLQRCSYLNLHKVPVAYLEKQHCFLPKDPYLQCPFDDLHTLSEGLLKGWVVWAVVCVASVAQLDPQRFELSLHTLDSALMGFPSVMIPEILRRHRFPQVGNVALQVRVTFFLEGYYFFG